MTLQSALKEQKAIWLEKVGPQVGKLVADDIAALQATAASALKAGAKFPRLSLPNQKGEIVDLSTLMAATPLIVTFYRGGWCPYCNLELRAYQPALPQIEAAGARLVAISPESPDDALITLEKNGVRFEVLSDTAGHLAQALGIHYQLSAAFRDLYEQYGIDLPARNRDGSWSLPLPATYVVARGGGIAFAYVQADFFERLDPAVAVHELEKLARG